MVMSSDIIMPFGKYKGKPLSDIPRNYLEDYLLGQEWFHNKFPDLKEQVKEQLTRRDRSHDTF